MAKTDMRELVWQRSSPSELSIDRKRMGLSAIEEATITIAQAETPTIASTWKSVADAPITDELLEWPADVRRD